MASEQINKDKLNELLGIHEGQSFEDYMNEGTSLQPQNDAQSVIDETEKMLQETKDKVDEIEQKFQSNIQVIDDAKSQLQTMEGDAAGSAAKRIDSLINVENAFKSIEDLVDSTKQMIVTVYGIISSCDVLDSETVSAAASLITSTKQLIAEYLGLYKQRVKYFDSVKMEMLKQQHRLEFMERKYQLDKEKYESQHPTQNAEVVDVPGVTDKSSGVGTMDMLKMLEEMDKEDEEAEEVVDEPNEESEDGE